jgi:hypothetical protein
MDYYEPRPDPDLLWQGDVIRDFIVPIAPEKISIVRNPPLTIPSSIEENGKIRPIRTIYGIEDLPDPFASLSEALVVDAVLTKVAIVSHSCDIDRKPFLTVAIVNPISVVGNKERREDVKKWDKVREYFWLPASEVNGLDESVIDLSLLYSVRAETLKAKIADRIVSMHESFRSKFQFKLAVYFHRPDE